tara:strand:+ start:39 stop:512 length:474 start_codon:yes stop_codon:yes gene_type:complete
LDSRKSQLQKQILGAIKANDNDLYSLLKSQWAHRFGVESLEELKNLDLNQLNQKPNNVNNQKIDQSQENSFKGDEAISIKDDDNQEKEIKIKKSESINDKNDELLKTKSYEMVNKEKDGSKPINSSKQKKSKPVIEALIPLPPKPKYGFLKKWLLRK